MISKIIRYLYYILFFLTPLLMYSKTSEIFEFNKIIFIYIMTVLIVSAWLIKMVYSSNKTIPRSIFFWIVGCFLLTQILSTLFSIDQHTSIYGYYGRFNGGLLSIIAYLLLFFVFVCEFSLDLFMKLLRVSLLSSLAVMLWGLPGKFGHDLSCGIFTGSFTNSCWTDQFRPEERMFSTLGQPNWLGAYLAIHFFIGMYFYFKKVAAEKGKKIKEHLMDLPSLLFLTYLTFNFIFILFTRSKTALVAVGVGIVGFSIFCAVEFIIKRSFGIYLIKKGVFIIGLCVLSVLIFKTGSAQIDSWLTFSKDTRTTISNIQKPSSAVPSSSGVTDSFDIRKIVWKGAWELTKDYPLFGTGVETFAYSYYFARPVEHNYTSEWDFLYNKAHNEYLNYLATTGFLGGGTYLVMIGFVCYLFIKKILQLMRQIDGNESENDNETLLVVCLFLAYITILVTNFTGFSTTTVSLFFYILPAFIIGNPDGIQGELKNKLSFMDLSAVIMTGTLAVWGVFFFFQYWRADIAYQAAVNEYRTGRYSAAAYDLLEVLKYHYEHVYEDKAALAIAGAAINEEDPTSAHNLILLSQDYNRKSIQASPLNTLYWRTQGNINFNFYQVTLDKEYLVNGLKAYQKAQEIAPTDPRMAYTVGLYALQLFDVEKDPALKQRYAELTEKSVNRAINLKPDYTDAYELKAKLYSKTGKKESAKILYEELLKKDPTNQDLKKNLEELQ
jgi:O-antigen ligase